MATRKAQKVFTYKMARFVGTRHELAIVLATALNKAKTLGERRQQLGGPEAPEWLVINEHRIRAGYTSAALVRYTPGSAAAALLDDPKATTATIKKYDAGTEGELRREWLESSMYVTAFKNHVVIMQSASLRYSQLETYLRWFLGSLEATEACGSLELCDKPAKATAEKIRRTAVRRIEIGGELTQHPAASVPPRGKAITHTEVDRTELVAKGGTSLAHTDKLEALSTLIGFKKFSSLNLKGLDESQVRYSLSLTIDRRRHVEEDQSQDVLNRLGSAFRNAEGVDASLELMDGSVVSGNDLRLTGKETLTLYDGLPSTGEVFDLMVHWLQAKSTAGDIEAS